MYHPQGGAYKQHQQPSLVWSSTRRVGGTLTRASEARTTEARTPSARAGGISARDPHAESVWYLRTKLYKAPNDVWRGSYNLCRRGGRTWRHARACGTTLQRPNFVSRYASCQRPCNLQLKPPPAGRYDRTNASEHSLTRELQRSRPPRGGWGVAFPRSHEDDHNLS